MFRIHLHLSFLFSSFNGLGPLTMDFNTKNNTLSCVKPTIDVQLETLRILTLNRTLQIPDLKFSPDKIPNPKTYTVYDLPNPHSNITPTRTLDLDLTV